MPLEQGRSKSAFVKNLKTEMHAGKPKDQSLAIAYAVKRKNAKKMAMGGVVENEKLHPENEPEHGAMDAVMAQMKLKPLAQNHEDLAEPEEPMEHVEPAEEDLPMHMMAKGGIVAGIMRKRMAAGGYPVPTDMNYAEGGPVDEMGLQDQEYDPDRFLAHNMPAMGYDHETVVEEGDPGLEEDPKLKRRGMISSIMSGLHAKHYGK